MSVQPKTCYTLDEYLALERSTRTRHEYFCGEVFAMGGASEPHNLIVMNVDAEFRASLRGRGSRVYASDLRVKIDPSGLYTYPDVVASRATRGCFGLRMIWANASPSPRWVASWR